MGKAARNKRERRAEKPKGYDNSRDKVCVGYVHPAEVSTMFHLALLKFFLYDGATTQRITGGGAHVSKFSSANISAPRNDIVREFLGTKADWLWFIDADMDFQHDTLERLLASADPDPSSEHYAPIVGGLCFGIGDGKLFPTLYGLSDEGGDVRAYRYDEYPHKYVGDGPACVRCDESGDVHVPPPGAEGAMFQVAATGAACILIHRSVLVAMEAKGFNKTYPWFQETELSGRPCGEDFTFCLRAGMLGYPIWVDTGVKIGHHKSLVLSESMYEEQRIRDRKQEAA